MNNLKGAICYLSGPMDRVVGRGKEWRDEVKPRLNAMNIGILNPLDKPMANHCSEDDDFTEIRDQLLREGKYDDLANLMKVDVCRPDLAMVDKSDFLLVWIDTDVHMAGTYHEVVAGISQRKPIIIVSKNGKRDVPFWWWGVIPHRFFKESWDEVFKYLRFVNDNPVNNKYWNLFDMEKIYDGCKLV